MKKFIAFTSIIIATAATGAVRQCSLRESAVVARVEQQYTKATAPYYLRSKIAMAEIGAAGEYKSQIAGNDIRWRQLTRLSENGRLTPIILKNLNIDQSISNTVPKTKLAGIGIVPRTSLEFEAVFGSKPTPRELENVKMISSNVPSIGAMRLGGRNVGDMRQIIEQSESKVVVIIGHNENGFILLLNGEKIAFSEIKQQCVAFQKYCIFLSCSSNKWLDDNRAIGVKRDLSYDDALEIARDVDSYYAFAWRTKLTNGQMAVTLPSVVESVSLAQSVRAKVKVSTIVGAPGVVLVVYVDER